MMKLIPLASAVLLLATLVRGTSAAATPCYAQNQNWRAWVERSPETGRRELVVCGTVTTPTGLNGRYLVLGASRGSKQPLQVVRLEINGIGDIATLAVETHQVRGRFAALPRYVSILIECNGPEIRHVSPVRELPEESEPRECPKCAGGYR